MNIAILKYNAGNIQSVLFSLERIGVHARVTDDHEEIQFSDKVIFPGVGEASSAMNYLKSKNLDKLIINLQQPVLGVCLGMQLLCSHSDESNTKCLGIFPQTVRKFTPGREQFLKVPQIGWNNIYDLKSAIFMGVPENSYCYFVHGYYAGLSDYTISVTDYVQPYSSGLHKGNFYGVQFHPEKSAEIGERIYQNFLQI